MTRTRLASVVAVVLSFLLLPGLARLGGNIPLDQAPTLVPSDGWVIVDVQDEQWKLSTPAGAYWGLYVLSETAWPTANKALIDESGWWSIEVELPGTLNPQVGWLYVDQPSEVGVFSFTGTTRVSIGDNVTLHARKVTRTEFIARLREITFYGVLASVYLARATVLSCLWVLTIVILRIVVLRAINWLPSRERRAAREEVTSILRVSKWGGVASYGIWTIKDLIELALQV
jgi:hypothetical protein